MRLRGIHSITPRWSQASRKRAIADLAESARRQHLTPEDYREILNRISRISSEIASCLERDRAYIIKGARFAREDAEMIPRQEKARHRKLLHYPEKFS